MTNRRAFIASGLLLPWALTIAQASADASLEVDFSYTGAGTVDEKHKVYIAVWDSPKFQRMEPQLNPLAAQSSALKQGKLMFKNLKAATVYISLGYDPTGEWHARELPSLNVWLGMYGTDDGKPRPIELHSGKMTKVSVTLDNSFHRPPDANGK